MHPADLRPTVEGECASSLLAIRNVDLFSDLSEAELAALGGRLTLRSVRRGEVLMRQGDGADALFVVVSGRFSVHLAGVQAPVTEIGAGQPVGEIAFLTGGTRTATVTAMRDSLVLALSRPEFGALVAAHPGVWETLTTTLARRLAATTSSNAGAANALPRPASRPKTICVIPAGGSTIDAAFVARLGEAFSSTRSMVVSGQRARGEFAVGTADDAEVTARLNALEAAHEYLLLITDDEVSEWTEKAIRHADVVLAVARHDDPHEPNDIERMAARFVGADATRLVLLHPERGRVSGTARWLATREVAMHHHVALNGADDIDRLVRFIQGRAVGLVAAGGGALAAAHTGVYKALAQTGVRFDIMGGTSAGAALVAAFMLDAPAEEIDAKLGEMFVSNRALRRYTLPRYSLLDHTVFDAELKRLFGAIEIEDLWLPFYAVSTNLSRFTVTVHRRGSLWRAIRASASIPVLLPPVYTDEGAMLVDGCLLDNVPVRVMHELKTGPNVVVSLKPPELDTYRVDYDALPSRSALMRLVLNPLRRDRLPDAPGLISVLIRALMANRRDFQRELSAEDVSLTPPIPAGVGFLDWHRHGELFNVAYLWTRDELASRPELHATLKCQVASR